MPLTLTQLQQLTERLDKVLADRKQFDGLRDHLLGVHMALRLFQGRPNHVENWLQHAEAQVKEANNK